MKRVLLFAAIAMIAACNFRDAIQVNQTVAMLERKEKRSFGKDHLTVQYWREQPHGMVYAEWLPINDTGSAVGTTTFVLVKR